MKIAIVGGGTAGFVSALMLKHTYPGYQIDIIKSSKIGTIGVGEGTTEHWKDFMEYVGISNPDIIKNCDATYKSGIRFENWGENDYMQTVESLFTEKFGDINFIYSCLASKEVDPLDTVLPITRDSEISLSDQTRDNIFNSPTPQYHFNTEKLNKFLTEISYKRGIEIIDDEIKKVEVNKDNEIIYIEGGKKHVYDFYVDCTGLKRLLISKLGANWNSYSDYLHVDTAIVFPTENEDYPMWTLARAMDAGWMFRIPVYGRKGNGYIYDSESISEEDAKREVEKYLGHKIEISKKIEFDPGSLDKFWIKNCCAIGLSANFVEPLEATSIGTSIQQSILLCNKIYRYTEDDIDIYNREITAIMDNIRDFVQLHYITEREDTPFWKKVKDTKLSDSLSSIIERFSNRMPVDSDFKSGSDKVLFLSANFFLVMYGLGLINEEKYQEQFENFPMNIKSYAHDRTREIKKNLKEIKKVSHKTVIDLIRDINL